MTHGGFSFCIEKVSMHFMAGESLKCQRSNKLTGTLCHDDAYICTLANKAAS